MRNSELWDNETSAIDHVDANKTELLAQVPAVTDTNKTESLARVPVFAAAKQDRVSGPAASVHGAEYSERFQVSDSSQQRSVPSTTIHDARVQEEWESSRTTQMSCPTVC